MCCGALTTRRLAFDDSFAIPRGGLVEKATICFAFPTQPSVGCRRIAPHRAASRRIAPHRAASRRARQAVVGRL
jgi:hypothetical protein